MPHRDWRPRLSIDLPPEAAQALRERLPYGCAAPRSHSASLATVGALRAIFRNCSTSRRGGSPKSRL